jgi:hypothetical protein
MRRTASPAAKTARNPYECHDKGERGAVVEARLRRQAEAQPVSIRRFPYLDVRRQHRIRGGENRPQEHRRAEGKPQQQPTHQCDEPHREGHGPERQRHRDDPAPLREGGSQLEPGREERDDDDDLRHPLEEPRILHGVQHQEPEPQGAKEDPARQVEHGRGEREPPEHGVRKRHGHQKQPHHHIPEYCGHSGLAVPGSYFPQRPCPHGLHVEQDRHTPPRCRPAPDARPREARPAPRSRVGLGAMVACVEIAFPPDLERITCSARRRVGSWVETLDPQRLLSYDKVRISMDS